MQVWAVKQIIYKPGDICFAIYTDCMFNINIKTKPFLLAKITLLFSLLILFVSYSNVLSAQEENTAEVAINFKIPSIALVNFVVEGGEIKTYTYSTAGKSSVEQVITPYLNGKTWLNYSSIVYSGLKNYITVHISSGTLPSDVKLNVVVGADIGAGAGTMGSPVGELTLSTYPQNIITDIGSCYTGVGEKKGHQLTYIWDNPDSYNYSITYKNGKSIAVTYTITSTE